MDKRIYMKKIVLDVDGVLLNFMKSFDETAKSFLPRKVEFFKDEYKQDYYHLSKRIGGSEKEADEILEYMQDASVYERLLPLDGAKEAVKKIKEAGFKVYVVTAVPERAQEMRLINLKNALDFVPDEIHCVGMGKSKKEIIEKINPDVFIDDRIDYLASVPNVYHTVWCDQREAQSNLESQVSVHVHSLKEWVDSYMPIVVKNLDNHYNNRVPLQKELKLESVSRKYKF